MIKASESFQIFVKPTGSLCNLGCRYCYYLDKEFPFAAGALPRMSKEVLEEYIAQHIEARCDESVFFSWHGGEPTLLGLDYFRTIVLLQHKYTPAHVRVLNGIQTNGVLINEEWCHFLADERFVVGLSLDGPAKYHDMFRCTQKGESVFDGVMQSYALLQRYCIPVEILCVVHAVNVGDPLGVYRFFKQIGARHITFLPLVERVPVSGASVPSEAWGDFLCAVFDEWLAHDIGRVQIQLFEEALRTAFGQEHSLCVFRPTCGRVPVVERNGDFYSCDHYVDEDHRLGNIVTTPLVSMLESPEQRAFGRAKYDLLPRYCSQCPVLGMCHGACPKDRFCTSPDGEFGLNYLCTGYKKFFMYCRPFVEEVASVWNAQQSRS